MRPIQALIILGIIFIVLSLAGFLGWQYGKFMEKHADKINKKDTL